MLFLEYLAPFPATKKMLKLNLSFSPRFQMGPVEALAEHQRPLAIRRQVLERVGLLDVRGEREFAAARLKYFFGVAAR